MNTARQKNKTQKKPKNKKNHQASSIGMGGGGHGASPIFSLETFFLNLHIENCLSLPLSFCLRGGMVEVKIEVC